MQSFYSIIPPPPLPCGGIVLTCCHSCHHRSHTLILFSVWHVSATCYQTYQKKRQHDMYHMCWNKQPTPRSVPRSRTLSTDAYLSSSNHNQRRLLCQLVLPSHTKLLRCHPTPRFVYTRKSSVNTRDDQPRWHNPKTKKQNKPRQQH
jgi:hypothetical protein